MTFVTKLEASWRRSNSLLCVGIDPDPERIPASAGGIFEFCCEIVDATAAHVCAFKPQIAHFSASGEEHALASLIEHIHTNHPGIPVILDAKRGDIGSTAKMYAREAFVRYEADAVTVNPYLGGDSLTPFLDYEDRGVFILCRTSNAGSADIQALSCDGTTVARHVARCAAGEWNRNRNIGLVVGATWPEELAEVRNETGDMPLLIPGVGAQGGDIKSVIDLGVDSKGMGLIINASRSINYASSGDDYSEAASSAAKQLKLLINQNRATDQA
jgi:orotidine-5'-phosphate decarboxylase